MNARDIILAPVITEKSVSVLGEKKYTFRVADGANKIEIAKAAEEIFGVKVAKVNTISMKGKKRRMVAMYGGSRPPLSLARPDAHRPDIA